MHRGEACVRAHARLIIAGMSVSKHNLCHCAINYLIPYLDYDYRGDPVTCI